MLIKKTKFTKFFHYLIWVFLTYCSVMALTHAAQIDIQAQAQSHKKIPVIIDTDMGIDDWFALLYLLNRSDVDILAITIPLTGQTHCQAGIDNVHKLIDLSGKMKNKHIPVACGQSYTQKFISPFPAKFRQDADSLGAIVLPYSLRKQPLGLSAEQVIQEVVAKQNKLQCKPMIITLGPLTTVANVLETDPCFKHKIAQIISMGGAVSVKGNVHYNDPVFYQNRVSDWNFYADPLAAQKVIESGIAFKLVPLDATDTVPLNQDFMKNFKKLKKTKVAHFVYEVIAKRNKTENHSGYCFWDSLTVVMAFNETIGSFKQLPITIKYGEPKISGQTVVDHQKGQHIQVALNANPQCFYRDFLAVINR